MTREELHSKLDKMVWSFTRISSFAECPKRFYATYIEHAERHDNALAQWGTLMHELIEENVNGLLPTDKLTAAYKKRFKREITEPFPMDFRGNDMKGKYYNDGLGFFFYYTGVPDEYEVLGAEIEVKTDIGRYKFIGYIDLLLRKRDTGELILIDHKSKNGFKSKKEQAEYARQLYLYAKYVGENFGRFPSLLVFNLIRKNTAVQIPFSQDDMQAAVDWAVSTIDSIYEADADNFMCKLELSARRKEMNTKYDKPDYFCLNICDQRDTCEATCITTYE